VPKVISTRRKSARVSACESGLPASILFNAAWYANGKGNYGVAEKMNKQAADTYEKALGPEHPSTLSSMANLASTYQNQGRWKEAEELEVQVMETSLTVLGHEHPDTLTSMSNLASTYWYQGQWKEAEELQVRVMETRKTALGTPIYANKHGQPGVDLPKSRTVGGGGEAPGASNGNEFDGPRPGAPGHADGNV
jgi:tetratricopeptide (TPR) repeat protein